jgi:phosphoribosylformimino-5-aminoimidazole carboxamide ribotide isomerase
MIIIPAIDLMGGKCVRLIKGERKRMINYEKDPLEIASEYTKKGASIIHIVDLDGAFTGQMKNIDIIAQLATRYSIQVGGGIRSEERIKELLALGVKKVVVSTLLLKDQKLANELKQKYKNQLIGSFDFKNNKLSYAGWTKESERTFEEVVNDLEEIIVTDTLRDGTLEGPNLELLQSIKKRCSAKIIAAGGVRNIDDLKALARIGMYGAIVGRAFLEGKIKPMITPMF